MPWKLLDHHGNFLNAAAGTAILELAETNDFDLPRSTPWGPLRPLRGPWKTHVEQVLNLPLVKSQAIREKAI